MMRRRDLISLGSLAALAPLAVAPAIAQQSPGRRRLGWLAVGELTDGPRVFVEALQQLGWAEGQNLIIDRRFAADREARGRAAFELVATKPDVLVGVGASDVSPLLAATNEIPIIFIVVGDPVALGFVASLRWPGGNVTGIGSISPELEPKQLQLLQELLPGAQRITMLRDPGQPGTDAQLAADMTAALSLGLTLVKRQFTSPQEIDAAFAVASRDHDDAVHVEFSGRALSHREQIIRLASTNRLPTIYGGRAFVEAGGLLSYSALYIENFRRAASLDDKVFHGAKPADLPVEEPTRFELVINLKTAKALGLTVPQFLLAQADEVIE